MERDFRVFINCPYDAAYIPMKQALMFAVIKCGFEPCLATMIKDAAKTRLEKIQDLILSAKYGFHDVSRCRASKKNEWYRLNMPFEMGLDFGNHFFSDKGADRTFLVLASERYSLQPSFSDFSGNDPVYYDSDPKKLIVAIRDFFYSVISEESKTGFVDRKQILADYERFQMQLYKKYDGIKDDNLSLSDDEYCDEARHYLFPSSFSPLPSDC